MPAMDHGVIANERMIKKNGAVGFEPQPIMFPFDLYQQCLSFIYSCILYTAKNMCMQISM